MVSTAAQQRPCRADVRRAPECLRRELRATRITFDGANEQPAPGQLPALTDGSVTIREAAAICLHLADRAAEKRLAPALGSPERASYYANFVGVLAPHDALLAYHGRVSDRPAFQRAFADAS